MDKTIAKLKLIYQHISHLIGPIFIAKDTSLGPDIIRLINIDNQLYLDTDSDISYIKDFTGKTWVIGKGQQNSKTVYTSIDHKTMQAWVIPGTYLERSGLTVIGNPYTYSLITLGNQEVLPPKIIDIEGIDRKRVLVRFSEEPTYNLIDLKDKTYTKTDIEMVYGLGVTSKYLKVHEIENAFKSQTADRRYSIHTIDGTRLTPCVVMFEQHHLEESMGITVLGEVESTMQGTLVTYYHLLTYDNTYIQNPRNLYQEIKDFKAKLIGKMIDSHNKIPSTWVEINRKSFIPLGVLSNQNQ